MNLCPYSDDVRQISLPECYLRMVSETENSVILKTWFVNVETDKAYMVKFRGEGWPFKSWIPKKVCKLNKEAETIEIQKWWASKNLIKWKEGNNE